LPPDADRQTEKLPFRGIEVMNVNQINLDSSRAGIGSFLDPGGQGSAAIGRLDGCVDLCQVEQAKAGPTGCLSTSSRAKSTLCRANTWRVAS
jgi:hypothetical protein